MTHLPTGRAMFTTPELHELGLSRHVIHRLVSTGQLHHVTRGLYTTTRPTGELLLRALQHPLPDLVFTGMTAVQLRTKKRNTTPVSVLVPRNRGFRSSRLVTVIRADHRPCEVIGGLRVAVPLRTVYDVPETKCRHAVSLLERQYDGRRGRLLLENDLVTRRKIPSLLRERINPAAIGADSETERQLFRALRRRGHVFEQNKLLGYFFRDGVNEPTKVVVEINGHEFHRAGDVVIKDRWKANDVVARGYRHLTFSATCIDMHLPQVVDFIIAVMEGEPCPVPPMGDRHAAWTQPQTVGLFWSRRTTPECPSRRAENSGSGVVCRPCP